MKKTNLIVLQRGSGGEDKNGNEVKLRRFKFTGQEPGEYEASVKTFSPMTPL